LLVTGAALDSERENSEIQGEFKTYSISAMHILAGLDVRFHLQAHAFGLRSRSRFRGCLRLVHNHFSRGSHRFVARHDLHRRAHWKLPLQMKRGEQADLARNLAILQNISKDHEDKSVTFCRIMLCISIAAAEIFTGE
jgi:hypothetical protein